MLLIWDVTSAAGAKHYYAACLEAGSVPDRQGYYSEGQESPGFYSGKLAERLGIAGQPVDKETFERLCDNLHPTEDGPLTPRTNDFRRVCKDFTFSAPKSFSIVEAFASEEERAALRRAFDEAVGETFTREIEPDMGTRVRRGGADHDRVTGNALAAGFDHLTSRPVDDRSLPDMHYHRHLLVWNATHDPVEDRIKAGQVGDIVRDKGYYRAAFYARLAGKLEALGYVIDRRGGNEWEIAGVEQATIDRFSKRTGQIDSKAAELGISDAAEKAGLGAKIRGRKQKDVKLPELRAAWAEQLTDGERDALARVYAREIAPGREVTPRDAVAYGIAHLSEQLSVFPERELQRVALLHGLGSVTPEQIAAELPRQGVIADAIDGRRMVTTQTLQAEERAITGQAAGGLGRVRPVGVAEGLSRALADGRVLNDGQWEAARGLLNSCNKVDAVLGPAGAGKSFFLRKFDEGLRLAGQEATYLATTTDAVGVLEKDGFAASTVARFIRDDTMQAAAAGGRVVVDESSLLGHADAYRLFKLAEKHHLKLIFVGDPMQHGSIGRGAFLRLLKDYGGVEPFQLTQIMRQETAEYRAIATQLSRGETLEGFQGLQALGWVREIGDADERCRQIAGDYLHALADKKSALVISPTHAEAAAITAEIRRQLREAGKLGDDERAFTRLVNSNASEAQRGVASTYRAGDVIEFHQNARGFRKGARLTITDPAMVPLSEAGKFSHYRPEAITLAAGDLLRFTGTVKTLDGHKLANGATKTVAGFTPGGNLLLDNGWEVAADAGHFRSGFVDTSFSSQGKTVQRAMLGMSAASLGATNAEQLYVSSSRAKERMTIYTDDVAAVRSGVQGSSQKLAALDLAAAPPASASDWQDEGGRLRRLAALGATRAAYDSTQRHPERPGPDGGMPPEGARVEQQRGDHHYGR